MKKEIITISGFPGSGKSSTADGVAKELGFKRFSSGDFMRTVALDRGMTLNELSVLAETDHSIDQAIDEEVKKAGYMTGIVIDSRLGFHWIPESFKVYLDLPPEIAKERIFNNFKDNALRKQSEDSSNADDVYQKITTRIASEKKRYQDLYGVDYTDKGNFDLVVDTDKHDLGAVIGKIIEEYKRWRG